eukprot:gnl/MRDRNA2_/MRDRNA2_83391_c0_seq2.p1 gnl/MRDRNA2_/MRDRNA2_83391_c0~~gnl/MRDRNA2_/MRDRNA2_83391_c0_seq2.p1  ORF type:complete len:831 (+),score=174.91 gnl/MRDRNA2_/MRDRNA2_83391_c0_seq2:41-2494(+)
MSEVAKSFAEVAEDDVGSEEYSYYDEDGEDEVGSQLERQSRHSQGSQARSQSSHATSSKSGSAIRSELGLGKKSASLSPIRTRKSIAHRIDSKDPERGRSSVLSTYDEARNQALELARKLDHAAIDGSGTASAMKQRMSVTANAFKRTSVGNVVFQAASATKRNTILASKAIKELEKDVMQDPNGVQALMLISAAQGTEGTVEELLEEPDVPPPAADWSTQREMRKSLHAIMQSCGLDVPEPPFMVMQREAEERKRAMQEKGLQKKGIIKNAQDADEKNTKDKPLKNENRASILSETWEEEDQAAFVDPDDILASPIRKRLRYALPVTLDDIDVAEASGPATMSAAAQEVLDGLDFYGLKDKAHGAKEMAEQAQQARKKMDNFRKLYSRRPPEQHEVLFDVGDLRVAMPRHINGRSGGQAMNVVARGNKYGGGEVRVVHSSPKRSSYLQTCPNFKYEQMKFGFNQVESPTSPGRKSTRKSNAVKIVHDYEDCVQNAFEEESEAATAGAHAHIVSHRFPPRLMKWEWNAQKNVAKREKLALLFNRHTEEEVNVDDLIAAQEATRAHGSIVKQDDEDSFNGDDAGLTRSSLSQSATMDEKPSDEDLLKGEESKTPDSLKRASMARGSMSASDEDSGSPASPKSPGHSPTSPASMGSPGSPGSAWGAARQWRLRGRGSWDGAPDADQKEINRIMDKLGLKRQATPTEEKEQKNDQDAKLFYDLKSVGGGFALDLEVNDISSSEDEGGHAGMAPERFWGEIIVKQPRRPVVFCPSKRQVEQCSSGCAQPFQPLLKCCAPSQDDEDNTKESVLVEAHRVFKK